MSRPDWMIELFGENEPTEAERAADAAAVEAETNRVAQLKAKWAAEEAERVANRCPKCCGEGRLSQFSHRKGGVCYSCGGSGIFRRFSA